MKVIFPHMNLSSLPELAILCLVEVQTKHPCPGVSTLGSRDCVLGLWVVTIQHVYVDSAPSQPRQEI